MKIRAWPIIVVAAPILFVAYCSHRDNSLEANFHKVAAGMTRGQVIAIMGTLGWEGNCSDDQAVGEYKPNNCVSDMRYAVTMAPIDPFYYAIWMDRNGKVIEADWYGSP